MKLSALLLTIVMALGMSAPLDARSSHKSKPNSHGSYKAPKVKRKAAKPKRMKFPKAKHNQSRAVKPVKVRKNRSVRTV
jgi:hypothetical protein